MTVKGARSYRIARSDRVLNATTGRINGWVTTRRPSVHPPGWRMIPSLRRGNGERHLGQCQCRRRRNLRRDRIRAKRYQPGRHYVRYRCRRHVVADQSCIARGCAPGT